MSTPKPITYCVTCRYSHPVTLTHCTKCGLAHFPTPAQEG